MKSTKAKAAPFTTLVPTTNPIEPLQSKEWVQTTNQDKGGPVAVKAIEEGLLVK